MRFWRFAILSACVACVLLSGTSLLAFELKNPAFAGVHTVSLHLPGQGHLSAADVVQGPGEDRLRADLRRP